MPQSDELFETFVMAYPAARRQRGYLATTLFLAALGKVDFETLMAAVEQQKRSEQWQTPRHIPLMTTWLEQERWIQVLPERPQVEPWCRHDPPCRGEQGHRRKLAIERGEIMA